MPTILHLQQEALYLLTIWADLAGKVVVKLPKRSKRRSANTTSDLVTHTRPIQSTTYAKTIATTATTLVSPIS